MAGLSAKEKAGCRELLNGMETPDLLSLAETVTNRLIRILSREEAIDATLIYSESAKELLKRKKVYRDIIFKYLAAKKVAVSPSSEKNQLIQHALEFWSDPIKPNATSASDNHYLTGQNVVPLQEKVHEQTYDSLDCQKLGEEFCKWFYQLLNAENPSLAQERGDWGPQHFWDNSVLKFEYNTTQTNREEYRGAQMASLRLLSLTREETLIFNPNMDSEGLKCANTPHGLVVVAVAGTVHRDNFCLGIFEQIFGLVNCPVTKNWKIKCINLKIIGHNVSGPSESLTRPCIKYETRDLEKLL